MDDWKKRLSHEIHSRGLKLTKVSTSLGFHRDYVSNVISGKAKPSAEKLEAICSEIGVPLTNILLGPPAESDDEIDDASHDELQRKALESVQDLIREGKFDFDDRGGQS